jgi:hypothetical protein
MEAGMPAGHVGGQGKNSLFFPLIPGVVTFGVGLIWWHYEKYNDFWNITIRQKHLGKYD